MSCARQLCRLLLQRRVRAPAAPRRGLKSLPDDIQPRFHAHLQQLLQEFKSIGDSIVSSCEANREVPADQTKRWCELKPIVDQVNDLQLMRGLLEDTERMIEALNGDGSEDDDSELATMAQKENRERALAIQQLELDIARSLLPEKPLADCAVILEVKIGVGGLESMLFASEVFQMYLRYVQYRGWSHSVVEEATAELGGLRSGVVEIGNGSGIYEELKHETGVHRVQRVPVTGDVIHTSTVTVFAMPKPADIVDDFQLDPAEIDEQVHHSSGKGGQSVNKLLSAVRLQHRPTGLRVDCQVHRTQHQNRDEGMRLLREKVVRAHLEKLADEERMARSVQDQRDRSDKIRTYNYKQGRVTDHRLRASHTDLPSFMSDGKHLHAFICALRDREFVSDLDRLLRDGGGDAAAERGRLS